MCWGGREGHDLGVGGADSFRFDNNFQVVSNNLLRSKLNLWLSIISSCLGYDSG